TATHSVISHLQIIAMRAMSLMPAQCRTTRRNGNGKPESSGRRKAEPGPAEPAPGRPEPPGNPGSPGRPEPPGRTESPGRPEPRVRRFRSLDRLRAGRSRLPALFRAVPPNGSVAQRGVRTGNLGRLGHRRHALVRLLPRFVLLVERGTFLGAEQLARHLEHGLLFFLGVVVDELAEHLRAAG